MAQTAGEYFLFSEEERWQHLPPKTENFKVNFEVTEDSRILKIILDIDTPDDFITAKKRYTEI